MTNTYNPDSPEAKACMSQPGGIHTLHPSPTNPRKTFNAADLAELTESVKAHGVLQPLLVRLWPADYPWQGDMPLYEIVAGERRYRAAKTAGLQLVPILIRDLSDREVLEIQIIENLQRSDLHPMEEAEGYGLMMQRHGYSADQLAEKIGKSRSYIFGRLKLLDLDEDSRRLFVGGLLNASTALLVARIPTAGLRAKAVKEITEPNYSGDIMSVRQAQRHLHNRFMLRLAGAPFPLSDPALTSASSCETCPRRTGNAPDLFDDVDSPDVCTDPDCYAEKKQAHKDREMAKIKDAGGTVIEGEAARKLAQYGIETYTKLKGYTQLDNKCYEDPEQRTYREIIGEDIAPVMIEDVSKNTLVPTVPNTILAEKLQAAGIKMREVEQAKANAKVEEKLKIERATRERLFSQVRELTAEMVEQDAALPYEEMAHILNMVTLRLWERTYSDAMPKIATLWGAVGKTATDRATAFAQTIPTMKATDCWKLLVDILAISGQTVTSEWDLEHGGKALLHLAESVFGINPAAARKAVTAELKAKEAEKKPAKAKGKVQQKNAIVEGSAFQIGDRVRVGNDLRGPNGNRRKCCGREGVIDEVVEDGAFFTVRFGEKSHEVVRNLVWNELEKLPAATPADHSDPSEAAQAGGLNAREEAAPAGDTTDHESGTEPGKTETEPPAGAGIIEMDEKPARDQTATPKIGDRVRIKENAKGANGQPRKCCGRVGTIEAIRLQNYAVRFSPKSKDFVAGITRDEIELMEEQSSASSEANEKPIAIFYPANKEEREVFYDCYCRRCAKDRAMREGLSDSEAVPGSYEVCDLVGASTMYRKDAAGYPNEWRYQGGVATCTAFVEFDAEPASNRCDKTVDMFDSGAAGV
jgi:ParB/RepB/Spo0J family partition protein